MFYYSHIVVSIILLTALYVHFHPAIPAEILPFEEKRSFLTVAIIIAVVLNIFLFQKQKENKLSIMANNQK